MAPQPAEIPHSGDRLDSGSRKRVRQHCRVQQSLRLSPRERTRNGGTALSRPRARFDIWPGRLRFGGCKHSAPAPAPAAVVLLKSAIVVGATSSEGGG
jgi:hypothetical protein